MNNMLKNRVFLYSSDQECQSKPEIFKNFCERKIKIFLDFNKLIKLKTKEKPPYDIIFLKACVLEELRDQLSAIKEKAPKVIIIAVLPSLPSAEEIRKLFNEGLFDIIQRPLNKEKLGRLRERLHRYQADKQNNEDRIRDIQQRFNTYQERNIILETLLELLSHDSKNQIIKIRSIMEQLPECQEKEFLSLAINELFTDIMEAVGYLQEKKRIHLLVDLISHLKIGKDRLPLITHSRIELQYKTRRFLYIESTPLIKNAITNLVENALKYSPPQKKIRIRISRKYPNILVEVIDHGCGISSQDKSRIFSRFFRSKGTEDIEGTGRGLWITKNLVKNEGGKLSVEDNPDGGSIFSLELPLFQIASREEGFQQIARWFNISIQKVERKAREIQVLLEFDGLKELPDQDCAVFVNLLDYYRENQFNQEKQYFYQKLNDLQKLNPGARKILICDDSAYVHYSLGRSFTNLGLQVISFAKDGREAIEEFERYQPDLVSMDITMPIMNGIEAAKELKRRYNSVRVLFISGLGDFKPITAEIDQFLEKQHFTILAKPCPEEELQRALRQLQIL